MQNSNIAQALDEDMNGYSQLSTFSLTVEEFYRDSKTCNNQTFCVDHTLKATPSAPSM